MDEKEKREELKFIIGRYDHYYDSVNNKGSFYLAINTFVLGGIVAVSDTILGKCSDSRMCLGLFVAILLMGAISLVSTLFSIKPYLNTKRDNNSGSLIFFGDVAGCSEEQYNKLWDNLATDGYYKDLRCQAALLSKGLSSKFGKLNIATWALIAQVILITILFIITTN